MSRKRKKFHGRFVAILFEMIKSSAFKLASGNSVKLYIFLSEKNWQEKKEGRPFKAPYSYYHNYFSKPTFYRALAELCRHGFIENVEKGGLFKNASIYKFSEKWMSTNPVIEGRRKIRRYYKAWGEVGEFRPPSHPPENTLPPEKGDEKIEMEEK